MVKPQFSVRADRFKQRKSEQTFSLHPPAALLLSCFECLGGEERILAGTLGSNINSYMARFFFIFTHLFLLILPLYFAINI